MKEHLLAFFGFPADQASSRDLTAELRQHWPEGQPQNNSAVDAQTSIPQIEFFDSWDHLLQNDQRQVTEPTACVIALYDEADFDALFPLFDLLAERAVPALILANDAAAVRERFFEDEVIVCPASEPMERIALRLHALVSRQKTVCQLKHDLKVARRCQGGLHGEITRIEEELQLAAMIQREFLPKTMPEVGAVRFGVLYKPAGYVSGDIYHIARLDEHHLGFLLADAVGHGVPAALMTMVIAHGLKMKEICHGSYRILPPGEVLAHLNESILNQHADNGRFATGVYGIIDVRNYQVTLATAGHPPPIKINRHGESEFIEGTGGLLGVFPDEEYDETTFTLQPGDRLFIYSDGFETAFPNNDDPEALPAIQNHQRRMPTLRYLEEIRNACNSNHDVTKIVETLQQSIDAQPGSLHQIDDLTGLCLTRLAEAAAEIINDSDNPDSSAPSLAA